MPTLQSKMPFGKYKGSTLAVVLSHTRYCKWLINQHWIDSELCAFIRENSEICGVCNNSMKGMYAGEGCFIRCPGCGWQEKPEKVRPLFLD